MTQINTLAALSSHIVMDAVKRLVAENMPKIGWTEFDKVLKIVMGLDQMLLLEW